MNLDEIQPFRSVGELTLGWAERKVIANIGENYVRNVDEYGDLCLEYEDEGIRCTFWKFFDFKLGSVSVERETTRICGKCLFGQSTAEIEQFIMSTLSTITSETDGVIHEDGHVQEWIEVDSHGLTFWFLNDALYLIDVTCDWTENDTPKWPSV